MRRRPGFAAFLFSMVLLAFKLSFYFSSGPVTGWDTLGHLHMARVYRALFADFDSIGYDPGWFQGFPAFYFYPPLYYFLTANLNLLLGALPFEFSFNVGMLGVLLFFCFAYLKLALLLVSQSDVSSTWGRLLLPLLGLLWYLSFSGDGLQGTALVGFLDGTVVATLGHALILFSLYLLERLRIAPSIPRLAAFTCTASLVYYTHFHSALWCLLILAVYFAVLRRSFDARVLAACVVAPLLLAWPALITYVRYWDYVSGAGYVPYYPGLLSILGTDFYERVSVHPSWITGVFAEVFLRFKWLNGLIIVLFCVQILKKINRKSISIARVLPLASVLFFWMALDTSLAYLVRSPGVHWYRAFDVAWSFGTMAAASALAPFLASVAGSAEREMRRFRTRLIVLAIFLISLGRFILWDPVAHEKYESITLYGSKRSAQGLEQFLDSIPRGSTILPEKVRDRSFFGSPHALDFFVEKHGHRNALGLMVESSLTPVVTYGYLLRAIPDFFVWGIDDRRSRMIYANAGAVDDLAGYLRRSGVDYVLTLSAGMQAYLTARPEEFTRVFSEEGVAAFELKNRTPAARLWPSGPVGFLTYERWKGLPHASSPVDFLIRSNQVRLRLGSTAPIIDLDPHLGTPAFEQVLAQLSGLVIFHSGPGLAPSDQLSRLAAGGLPLFPVNFERTSSEKFEGRYLYTLLEMPVGQSQALNRMRAQPTALSLQASPRSLQARAVPSNNASCTWMEFPYGFFPDWKEPRGLLVFRTDTNHMLVCAPDGRAELWFSNLLSKPLTVMMYALICSAVCGAVVAWKRGSLSKDE